MDAGTQFALSFLNSSFEEPLGAARWWAENHSLTSALPVSASQKPRFDAALTSALCVLRGSAQRWGTQGQGDTAAAGAFNEVLSRGRPVLVETTAGFQPGWMAMDGSAAVLLPAAYACTALLLSHRAGRLGRCANSACEAFFLDETKNGSRRWCALACMERVRAPRRRLRR